METHTIHSVAEFIPLGKRLFGKIREEWWWRGQASSDWGLTTQLLVKGLQGLEAGMFHEFRNSAPVRYPNCPDSSHYLKWLF